MSLRGLGAHAVPFHDGDAGWPSAALGDRQESVHSDIGQLFFIEDGDVDANLFEFAAARCKLERAEGVGRLVDEVAGQSDAVCDRVGAGEVLFGGIRIRGVDRQALEFLVSELGSLVVTVGGRLVGRLGRLVEIEGI